MMNDPIYGQISCKYCLSVGFKWEFGFNPRMFLLERYCTEGKRIAKHVIRPSKVIPASCVEARCVQMLITIHRL